MEWIRRKLEAWNQRNTDYYKRAFQTLEQENKTSFNWAACLFSEMWLIYRKMYGWFILCIPVYISLHVLLLFLFPLLVGVSVIVAIIMRIACGYFGNRAYYITVKSRIKKGYHLKEDYNAVNPIGCAILENILPFLLCISPLLASLFPTLIILIPFLILFLLKETYNKFRSRKSSVSVKINDDSINQYLDKANVKDTLFAVCLFLLLGLLEVEVKKFRENMKKNQPNQTTEEMHKIPNSSENKNISSN